MHRARLGRRPQRLDGSRQQPAPARPPRRGDRHGRARARALAAAAAAAHSNAGVVLMQLGRFDEAIEHFHARDRARARQQQASTLPRLRAARRRRARRGVRPWDRGSRAARAAASATNKSALDARPTPTRASSVPRAGRRRRDPVRVAVPRSHRRGERRRHRDRPPARHAVRAVVPDGRGPRRRRTTNVAARDDARLRLRDPGRQPHPPLPPGARRLPRSALVPRRRPERVEAWQRPARRRRAGPVRRHVVAQPDADRGTPARVHPARPVGRALRHARRHLGQPPVRRLRPRPARRRAARSA